MMEELGSGFYLAMHDLEIRGAGEVLGENQIGRDAGGRLPALHRHARTRGALAEGRAASPTCRRRSASTTEINLHVPALLPDDYCGDVHERLSLYKRLANCEHAEDDSTRMQEELIDRFGKLPDRRRRRCSTPPAARRSPSRSACRRSTPRRSWCIAAVRAEPAGRCDAHHRAGAEEPPHQARRQRQAAHRARRCPTLPPGAAAEVRRCARWSAEVMLQTYRHEPDPARPAPTQPYERLAAPARLRRIEDRRACACAARRRRQPEVRKQIDAASLQPGSTRFIDAAGAGGLPPARHRHGLDPDHHRVRRRDRRHAGRKAEVAAITEAAMRGEIADYKESLRRRVALLEGLAGGRAAARLRRAAAADPRRRSAAGRGCKAAGLKTLLVSGGFTFFTDRVATGWASTTRAPTCWRSPDGQLTGTRASGDIVDADEKSARVRARCARARHRRRAGDRGRRRRQRPADDGARRPVGGLSTPSPLCVRRQMPP